MLLVAIIGSAPDCNCRALRAAPFTRLYLLWRGFSIDIVSTSGIPPIYAKRGHLSWQVSRWITRLRSPLFLSCHSEPERSEGEESPYLAFACRSPYFPIHAAWEHWY